MTMAVQRDDTTKAVTVKSYSPNGDIIDTKYSYINANVSDDTIYQFTRNLYQLSTHSFVSAVVTEEYGLIDV